MTTDRIKEIQSKTAYPDSVSVQQALLQVWNECEQEQLRIGGVSNWVTFEENPPNEDGRYLIKQNEAVYIADYYAESDIWQDDYYNRITGVDYWMVLPE